jgi:hypothetical protein
LRIGGIERLSFFESAILEIFYIAVSPAFRKFNKSQSSAEKLCFLFLTEEAYSHGTTPDKEVWPSPFKCQPAPI